QLAVLQADHLDGAGEVHGIAAVVEGAEVLAPLLGALFVSNPQAALGVVADGGTGFVARAGGDLMVLDVAMVIRHDMHVVVALFEPVNRDRDAMARGSRNGWMPQGSGGFRTRSADRIVDPKRLRQPKEVDIRFRALRRRALAGQPNAAVG